MQLTFFKIFDFASDARLWQLLTKHSISLRLRILALRKIVEKEIERSNATVPGDDKIGSRVSWWFAGSARFDEKTVQHVWEDFDAFRRAQAAPTQEASAAKP
jgi:hypothetical protein